MKRFIIVFLALFLCVSTAQSAELRWFYTPLGQSFFGGGDDGVTLDWPLTSTLTPTKAERNYNIFTNPTHTSHRYG